MSVLRITMYAIAMTICAITAGVSSAVVIMSSPHQAVAKQTLPKPPNHCPECQDAAGDTRTANGE